MELADRRLWKYRKNRRSREHYRRGCQCKSGVMDDRERTDRFSVYDFTHHAKSTRSLLLSLRNSLLKEGSFQSERVALEQVTEVVRFDVHLHMSREGQRYIERISEIVPDTESPEGYRIVELVRFDGERYVKLHTISETTRAEMVKWLTKEEKEAFSMWIFEGILYVILLLVFIRYDRKSGFG